MKSLSKRLEEFKAGKRAAYQKSFGPGQWLESGEYVIYTAPRRSAGKSHEIIGGMRHTGWFADNFQDELYVGEVWRLPHGKFIAGYREQSGAVVFESRIFDDKEDAALSADGLAESAADKGREDCAKHQAEQDIVQARENIHELNKEAMEILRELKGVALPPAICSAVRGSLKALLRLRKAAFTLIEAREQDYWSAVPE